MALSVNQSGGLQGPVGPVGPAGTPGAVGVGVPSGGTTGQILAKTTNTDYDLAFIDPPVSTGTANRVSRFDSAGNLSAIEQWQVSDEGYVNAFSTVEPTDLAQSLNVYGFSLALEPTIDSPNETWNLWNNQINADPNNSGFQIGTNGQGFRFEINNFYHHGLSDIGSLEFIQNTFDIGNGTDPINVKGFSYLFGFGQFNDNVTISGAVQGYGFQPNLSSGVLVDTSVFMQAFYDNANIQCESQGHLSFNASPNIAEIANGKNYQGVSVNPNIPIFNDNSGFIGLGVGGNYGTMGVNTYWQGVNVNPNITEGRYAVGLNVSMDNVTVYPGVVSSLVVQDLTISANVPSSFADTASIEYTGGGTAGSEIVTQPGGLNFSVQIESGVSTATQIETALNAFLSFTQNFNVVVSGTGSNTQTTFAQTNLAGGEDPGRKQAAYLDGDVEITGGLTFGGSLAIGALNAFFSQPLVDGTGNPASVHSLVSQMTVADNTNITSGDTFGVNTAMLLAIGNNSNVTTSFVGLSALALPAVVSLGTGSSIDQVAGATFALSLDAGAAGGSIGNLDLCRSLAIPNGVTTVTRLAGYKFDLPFGDPGTTTWGFYASPDCHNYLAGNLKIGGADTVASPNVALEIESSTKAFLNARMNTTARDAMMAIDGMQIYNATTSKFQGYASGAWVDLH